MGGYYPDGVTGNEYAINGPKEGSEAVSCGRDDIVVAPTYLVTEAIEDLNKQVIRIRGQILATPNVSKEMLEKHTLGIELRLLKLKEELDTGMEGECNFEDTVDGEYRSGMFLWTCPRCGMEHETDVDDDDDYDDRDD